MASEREDIQIDPEETKRMIEDFMINMRIQDHDVGDYFSIRNLLKNSYYNRKGILTKNIKNKCNLFDRRNDNEPSLFENLATSHEDKSAVISLILRTYNLWNDHAFWTETVNLEQIMRHFATDEEVNAKNLFSILLYDWHCPSETSTTYDLCEKVAKYELHGKSMFSKLFKIIDDEKYQGYELICLRIIYHILHEKNESLKEQQNFLEKSTFQDQIAAAANEVLEIKNEEIKMKILKILAIFLGNSQDEECRLVQERILEYAAYDFECKSAYRMSLESIQRHCDEKYFRLVFLLKENRLKKFEGEFEEFIKSFKKLYGEYWKIAIKENLRLLFHTAEEQCERPLLKIVEFIFKKCPFIELNSTILTTFEEIAEFYQIFNEPLLGNEFLLMADIQKFLEKDSYNIKDEFVSKFLNSKVLNRKLLFGRRVVNELSLLEKIFSHPELSEAIEDIWKKFQLYGKPELMIMRNFMDKPLMHYANEAGIHQIAAFIALPSKLDTKIFKKTKQNMMLQNSQIYSVTGKSLIEHHIDLFLGIQEQDYEVDIFTKVVYMLEEIGKIEEIKSDEIIDYMLDLMKQTDRFNRELFEIDDLLGIMVTYWIPNDGEYQNYKQKFIDINPFFEILFMVVEKQQQEFCDSFMVKFENLEDVYESRYDVSVLQNDEDSNMYELYSSNFMFVLFLAAIRTEQPEIIDVIFQNDCFVTIEFGFPENIVPGEIHYYAASNLLKHGHELGGSNIPKDWLTHEVLRSYLDSRINYYDKDFIEIDCSSMLHAETQKIKIKESTEISDGILMLEDTVSLEYIKEHENLKTLITHPVIETYIELKSHKYQRIFVYNFWGFMILYVFPFVSLISYNLNGGGSQNYPWIILISDKYKYIGVTYLVSRETFQLIIAGGPVAYFKQRSNLFDMLLIILAIGLSITSSNTCGSDGLFVVSHHVVTFLQVTLILLTTISATSLLPLPYVPINMQILRKVSMTFLRLFYTFAIILIAYSFSFRIMFEFEMGSSNCTANSTSIDGNIIYNDNSNETVKNFKYPLSSIVKIVTMLSGEYSIEPFQLSHIQLVFFAVFVIMSLILFNLILGLSIEDVQELKRGSIQFNLLTKTKKLIGVGYKMRAYFNAVIEFNNRDRNNDGKREAIKEFLVKLSLPIVRFFLSKYIYVHSIKKVYVDIKTKEVYVNINRNYESILKIRGYRKDQTYTITDQTKAEIQAIIDAK